MGPPSCRHSFRASLPALTHRTRHSGTRELQPAQPLPPCGHPRDHSGLLSHQILTMPCSTPLESEQDSTSWTGREVWQGAGYEETWPLDYVCP